MLNADETPVGDAQLQRGQDKTRLSPGDARGTFDAVLGVIYDFCVGRGARFPIVFLGAAEDSGRS